jgi:hypothetical protein
MAKLTKRQKNDIQQIIKHLQRGQSLIDSDSISVCRKKEQETTSLDFVRKSDGSVLYEIDKEIGSNLTGFPEAARLLHIFLNEACAD